MNRPCECGHMWTDHFRYAGAAEEQTATTACELCGLKFFHGMTYCYVFRPMSNLNYLKWKYDQAQHM